MVDRRDSGIRALRLSLGEVRSRVLSEHQRLRKRLVELQGHARHAALEPRTVVSLRSTLREFIVEFGLHIDSEEELLVPALESIDAGSQASAMLRAQHEQQRSILRRMHAHSAVATSTALAEAVDSFVLRLLRDLRNEEKELLREELLSDDAPIASCG